VAGIKVRVDEQGPPGGQDLGVDAARRGRDFPSRLRLKRAATSTARSAPNTSRLAGKIAYVNVGLEGPRATTNRVRGDYDKVMAGIRAFQDAGLPLSLSAVVYRSTLAALPYTGALRGVHGDHDLNRRAVHAGAHRPVPAWQGCSWGAGAGAAGRSVPDTAPQVRQAYPAGGWPPQVTQGVVSWAGEMPSTAASRMISPVVKPRCWPLRWPSTAHTVEASQPISAPNRAGSKGGRACAEHRRGRRHAHP
jgi:hypothetical protein